MGDALRLWSVEMDEMRPEARAAVEAGLGMFAREEPPPGAPVEERVRAQREAHVSFPVPEAIEREIAGVPCRTFLPGDDPGTVPRAVYLHFHGGGMIAGSPAMMDYPNRDLARDHGLVVVSPDYRKAPEHPFPAGPDDAFAVASWLVAHAADEYGTDRLIIGGESAGGYLTAVTGLRIRDELCAADRVLGLNLVFGVYDWGRTPSQRGMRPHEGPDILSPEGVTFVADCYLPGRTDEQRRDPAISPAYADLHDLPAMFLSVGTCDHLVDDTLLLATRAAAAGNEVELFVAPDMPHAFFAFPCALTKLWADRFNDWLERILTR